MSTKFAKALTPQESVFAKHFVLTGNGRQSAILAQYSTVNASGAAFRLLKRERVLNEIKRLQNSMMIPDHKGVTREMLENFYVQIMKDKANSVDQKLKASDFLCKLKGFYRRDIDVLLALDSHELQQTIDRLKDNTVDINHQNLPNG